MRKRNIFGTDIFICPQNLFYYIEYNPEPISTGRPKSEFLESGEIKKVRFAKTKVRDTAIIPRQITRDRLQFNDFDITTLDKIKVKITGLAFDIVFDSAKKPGSTQKGELDQTILDSITKYRHFFPSIPLKESEIKDANNKEDSKGVLTNKILDIKDELINAIKNAVDEAFKESSFIELWMPTSSLTDLSNKINSKFQIFPFKIVPNTLSNFNIDKLTNLRPGIIQEIAYPKENKTDEFTTNENIKLKNLRVGYKVEIEDFEITKYKKWFQSLEIDGDKKIEDWVEKRVNLEKILKTLTYSNLTGNDKGETIIKEKIRNAFKSYPISLIDDSITIYFDMDNIPIEGKIYHVNIEESNFTNKEDAKFDKISVNFSFFLEIKDNAKVLKLFSNLSDKDVINWVEETFEADIINKIRAYNVDDLKEKRVTNNIMDFINTLINPFALFISESEKVNIIVKDPSDIDKYIHGEDVKVPYDMLPIVKYHTVKTLEKYKTFNFNQEELINEEAKSHIRTEKFQDAVEIEKILEEKKTLLKKKTLLEGDLKNGESGWVELKKDEIRLKLEEYFLFHKAKDEFFKEQSDNKLVSNFKDFDLKKLEEELNNSKVKVTELKHKLFEADKKSELKKEELLKEHEATLKRIDIEINSFEEKYNFNKEKRWEFLLNQSALKDQQAIALLGDIFKFLFLLQYTEKDKQEKTEIFKTLAELLHNDSLNSQEIIRIINKEEFALNELIKSFSTNNHFTEILNEIFNSKEIYTERKNSKDSKDEPESDHTDENNELL